MKHCQWGGSLPRPTVRSGLVTLVLAVGGLSLADPASALPRYSAVYGQDCKLCHVNPTGGGMRTLYASQYIVPEELAGNGWKSEEMENLSPQISPNIAVGVDLRTLLYQQEGGKGTAFSMQGDLYVNVMMSQKVGAYIEQGQSGSGEIFGITHAVPLDGYLKAGRFVPDYGWRYADHQMFNRRYLLDPDGTDNPATLYSSGFELGVSPGILTASASLLGGSESNGDNYAGRVVLQQGIGPVNAAVGGSILRRQFTDEHRRSVGGFWYLGAGPVVWLGQIDETRQEGRLGNLVTQELTVRVHKGVDLRGTYSFQDPDRAQKNGARHRSGAGVAWMPTPYFATQAMGNYWKIDQGDLVSGDSYYEAELMVHFFY